MRSRLSVVCARARTCFPRDWQRQRGGQERPTRHTGTTAGKIQAALEQAAAGHDLQADLRHDVLQYPGRADTSADLGASAMSPPSSPSYASIAGKDIGAVLEISLTQLMLGQVTTDDISSGGSNPRLNLIMTARARLVRVSDGRVLWNAPEVTHEALTAQLSTWTARESDLLKTEIANGTKGLARRIGEGVFGANGRIETEPNNAPPPIRYLP